MGLPCFFHLTSNVTVDYNMTFLNTAIPRTSPTDEVLLMGPAYFLNVFYGQITVKTKNCYLLHKLPVTGFNNAKVNIKVFVSQRVWLSAGCPINERMAVPAQSRSVVCLAKILNPHCLVWTCVGVGERGCRLAARLLSVWPRYSLLSPVWINNGFNVKFLKVLYKSKLIFKWNRLLKKANTLAITRKVCNKKTNKTKPKNARMHLKNWMWSLKLSG